MAAAMTAPRFANALSTREESDAALAEALAALEEELEGAETSLVLAFLTPHHGSLYDSIGPRLATELGCDAVLGCTGESIVGGGREIERRPGLSLWAAHLPETHVRPFGIEVAAGPGGEPRFRGAPDVGDASRAAALLLADPHSFPVDPWLEHFDVDHPGVAVIGGLASGGSAPGQNRLLTAEGSPAGGAVGVVVEGAVEIASVVSQGCRPIGASWVVTAGRDNLVEALGGRPAAEVLMETLGSLPEDDRQLFQRQPFFGLAVDATKSEFDRGDFLVRPVLGLSRDSQAIAIGAPVRRGQSVQFLVRDADSAGEDLTELLRDHRGPGAGGPASRGALLFSCNGRGTRMFPVRDHDVSCVRAGLSPDVPVAGFFANGEIGPVGNRNFLHGFTASVALFRARADGSA